MRMAPEQRVPDAAARRPGGHLRRLRGGGQGAPLHDLSRGCGAAEIETMALIAAVHAVTAHDTQEVR
ncbi:MULTISPECIES: hypothetical protein [Amycolatopsis]|uniref:hypothetical protein n=1 Tax=Amycolatopsis TaxID=1813 RepID=UPI000B8AB853|nr:MULTISPECIES: hypothetical protein [Amycolatopsis]OXM75165.1 hypothetical protein CF166_00810 [Amycolatopsis sp. KNN50.9b]